MTASKVELREGDEGFVYEVGKFYGRGGVGAEAAVAEPAAPAEPAAKEPAAKEPAAKEPAAKEPVAAPKEPVGKAEPAVKEVAKEPAAEPEDPADFKWPSKGFPPDWRERSIDMLGLKGDEATKEKERLARFSSPAEMYRANREADKKISTLGEAVKGLVKIPGKDAKAEDHEAFDKAWDVPKETAEYLKVLPDPPKELGKRSAEDLAAWAGAMPIFQAKKFNKEQVATMVAAMDQYTLQSQNMLRTASKAFDKEAADTLRVEWNGKGQFDTEVEIANRAAEQLFGDFMDKQERLAFFNLTLDNGRKIGSYPKLVKAFNRLGREGLDAVDQDTPPETGESASGQSLDEQIKAITKLSHTNRPEDDAKYKQLQPKLQQLMERKVRRDKKAG